MKKIMIDGIINNCEKCFSSYGQYNDKPDSNFTEYWCEWSIDKKPKGLCQFCNPKSKFFIEKK